MGILETVGHWVISLISATGYFGVFIAMAIESCLIPLPSEVTMPFAGALAASGELNLILVSLAGAFGNLVGSWGAYYIGVKFPESAIIKFLEKWGKFLLISPHEYEKAKSWLSKYGSLVSFFSRLLPGIRTVISLPCGVARINFTKFSILTFLGSLLWSFILAFIGFKLGENWESIKQYFHKLDLFIILAGLTAVGLYIYMHLRRKK
ncbi:MAG: DedA family protein [Candidatus Dojkabacteria bacterium]|nr:DedA family protein [Candidatus Dojkabacteria bacterium]